MEIDNMDLLVGKGISNALQYFGQRGMLGSHFEVADGRQINSGLLSMPVVKGRMKDQTLGKQLKEFGVDPGQERDRVKLNYTDKQGNQLSIKQAFRELCWAFHGRGPAHKNKERLQRNLEK